jgi:hypothetical protein
MRTAWRAPVKLAGSLTSMASGERQRASFGGQRSGWPPSFAFSPGMKRWRSTIRVVWAASLAGKVKRACGARVWLTATYVADWLDRVLAAT